MSNPGLDDILSCGSYHSGREIEIPMMLNHFRKNEFIDSLDVEHRVDLYCAIEFLLSKSYVRGLNNYYSEQLEHYHNSLIKMLVNEDILKEFEKLGLFTSIDRVNFGRMLVMGNQNG